MNSGAAQVTGIRDGRLSFPLEDGRTIKLGNTDPQGFGIDDLNLPYSGDLQPSMPDRRSIWERRGWRLSAF